MLTRAAANFALGLILVGCCNSVANAELMTFTWNPAGASPALAGAGSSFTADSISTAHYFHAVVPTSGPFAETFIDPVQGFAHGGASVPVPGLNGTSGAAGSYGLYFSLLANFEFVAGVPTFHSLDVALKADPGNNNGTLSSTISGVAFANAGATGAADDITLATGSLSSATLALNPTTGTRNAHFLETFHAVASESGFFVTPLSAVDLLEGFLTTPASVFTTAPGPSGATIQMVNGGTGVFDIQVPEPTSLAVLCAAVGGVIMARRRNRGTYRNVE